MGQNPEFVRIIFFEAGCAGGSVNRLYKLLEKWNFASYPAGLFTFYDCKKAHQLLQSEGLRFSGSFGIQDEPLPDPVWKLGPLILPTRFGIRYFFRALSLLKRHPQAHVYINNTPYSHLPLIAAAKLLNRKISCHLRDTINFTALERLIIPCVDSFVALSKVAQNHYIKQGIAPERIQVIYDSVDADLYANDRQAVTAAAQPVKIAVIGTLTRRKGQDVCIKALSRVVQKYRDTQLVLVGDGDFKAELSRMAADSSLGDNVIFRGHSEEVSSILSECHIGVLSSRREGMPNSVMEYMASGLPVVVTDLPGIGELVLDKVTGFVVEQESDEQLADRLIQLIESPLLRSEMGLQGIARIRSAEFAPLAEVSGIEKMVFHVK